MEYATPLTPSLVKLLVRGGTILTGNQRAARTLRTAFDLRSRANGLSSWQPPDIFAWNTWTSQLWHQSLLAGASDKLLLNRTQELRIWASVISADSQWTSLQTVESLASMAAGAWQLLCNYRGQSQLRTLGVSEDTRAFQRWAQSFVRRCTAERYLSPSELETALVTIINSKKLVVPTKEIFLLGFDSMTPAQSALIEGLRAAGVDIHQQDQALLAEQRFLAPAQTLDDEVAEAALWLREMLEADPEARIAVIHADIATDRNQIERVFRQVLAPELESIVAGRTDGPFEFSLGQPLLLAPMVSVAMTLLRWIMTPVPIAEISRMLLSPHFCPASELQSRSAFDASELRHSTLLRPELSVAALLRQLEDGHYDGRLSVLHSQLHAAMRTTAKLVPDPSKQKPHADWADNLRELLQAFGWASMRRDDSVEFQTRRKWEGALDELATLDFEGTRPTFAEALGQLEGILQRTLFAPESRDAQIQIMSPQEAAGSRFDVVYFMRASELAWPSRIGANPMLGWRLQRKLAMPGSDPTRDLAQAKAVTARLVASANAAVFSYARETPDGHQRPSPLLAGFDLQSMATVLPANPAEPVQLEEMENPGYIPLANPKVRGGASVLKLQAACGFRAFAQMRLLSSPLDTLEPGMTAAERGSIVHNALDHLWHELRTHAALKALSPEQRSAQLHRSISHSLRRSEVTASSAWDTAYLEVQHERLYRLLSSWLELELARSPFEVKLREQEFEDLAIGPLLLSLRVDRVDTPTGDASDTEIIIDYKTGPSHPSGWTSERPDEPQLPLYAALRQPGTVSAVAFGQVRPGIDMGLKGYAASEDLLPRPLKLQQESLDAQIADWHRILTSLAEDFASGDARVRPKEYPHTCEFCAQRILCRLDPTLLEEDFEEAEETEAVDG